LDKHSKNKPGNEEVLEQAFQQTPLEEASA
jgi:hypothetical protein